jgi:hypothetical protein
MKSRKIWIGIGTAILVSPQPALTDTASRAFAKPSSAVAQSDSPEFVIAQHNGPHAPAKAGGEGEGGEGEGARASLPPNLRFYHDIQLVRGHLFIADELVKEGRWNDALAHVLHPSEEIYGSVRVDLKTFDVPPFQTALKALAQTVKSRNKDAYATALAGVDERLAAADRSLRGKEQNWPSFILETVMEVLQTATDEYEAAVDDSRIKNVVEYQDARGFVWQAEKLFESVADELTRRDAEATKAIRAAFAELKKTWPTAMPPKSPVKDLSQVLAGVSTIELQLGRLR